MSNSKHTSPAFIVNKHSEQKRGKSRMVIDYRNLDDEKYTQIDYIDYELESEDSIYEISENENDMEIQSDNVFLL